MLVSPNRTDSALVHKLITGADPLECSEVTCGNPGGTDVDANNITWLSTREAARRLGLTARTLYRLIDNGELPAYRFGRVIRLQAAEVDAFIEQARITPGTLEHLYADGASEAENPEPSQPSLDDA